MVDDPGVRWKSAPPLDDEGILEEHNVEIILVDSGQIDGDHDGGCRLADIRGRAPERLGKAHARLDCRQRIAECSLLVARHEERVAVADSSIAHELSLLSAGAARRMRCATTFAPSTATHGQPLCSGRGLRRLPMPPRSSSATHPGGRRRMNIASIVGPALASNDATNRLMLAAHAWRRDGALITRTGALSVATDPVQQIQEMEHDTPLAMDLTATLARLAALPPSTEAPYLTVSLDWRPEGSSARSFPGARAKAIRAACAA